MTRPQWMDEKLLVIDLEGNGGVPPEVVEVAIVPIENGQIGKGREWLVRPTEKISPIVSRIHGITNDMVASAPSFETVREEIRAELRDHFVIAHNAQADVDVLGRQLYRWEPKGVIDTLRIARAIFPGRKSYSLNSLGADLDLLDETSKLHRAASDALLAAKVFLFCVLMRETPQTFAWLTDPKSITPPAQGSLF